MERCPARSRGRADGGGRSSSRERSGTPRTDRGLPGPAPRRVSSQQLAVLGPMEAVTPATRFPELEAIVRDYSPYLFSPLPDELLQGPVSDYFAAWDGGLAGFLASRTGHPFFTVEGGDLVGWIDYFDAVFDAPVPLEPLAVLRAGRSRTCSTPTAGWSGGPTGSASTPGIPSAGAAGTTISASSAGRTSSRTSRPRRGTAKRCPSTSSRSTTATRPRSATG